MRRLVQLVSVVVVFGAVGCGPAADDLTGGDDVGSVTDEARAVAATGKGIGTRNSACWTHSRTKITYHNGPVLTGIQDVYFIFYGNWANSAATQTILTDLASTVGNTPYMQVNNRYADGAGNPATAALVYGGSVTDSSYAHGTALSDADIASIIGDQILNFRLPQDPSGIYVVFTSKDVNATSGFCRTYCGQHNSAVVAGGQLRYIFVGHSDRCRDACSPQSVSPNGDAAGDAMASTLAGELTDTLTDPALTAWYDKTGLEAADKCAWTYGPTYTTANGAQANIHLGSRDFLLQRTFWRTNRGGVCAMNPTQAQAQIAVGQDIL
jgi:phosphate-induced protein 1